MAAVDHERPKAPLIYNPQVRGSLFLSARLIGLAPNKAPRAHLRNKKYCEICKPSFLLASAPPASAVHNQFPVVGQSRRLRDVGGMSGLLLTADISGPGRHFAFVPNAAIAGRLRIEA